jgi:hypothetical protein
LGLALGLPLPRVEVIEVPDWLIEQTEDLRINLGGSKLPCRRGKQLGSLYVGSEGSGMTLDYLPRELLERVLNVEDFPRVLVLDKWTCCPASSILSGQRQLEFPILFERYQQQSGLWEKSYKRGCQVKNTSPCRNARNIFRHPAPSP